MVQRSFYIPFTAGCLLCLCAILPVHGQEEPVFDNERALAYSQSAIGRQIGSYRLTDSGGEEFSVGPAPGKPLVVSFVFSSCYHVCPLITANLQHVTGIAGETLGEDSFDVLTVGFDTVTDTPQRMREYARARGVDGRQWRFLSGDEQTIARMTRDLGFIFFPSPRGFDHLAQITIIDAEGVIYRQIYGDSFTPPQLVEPLKELVFGTKSRLPLSLSEWVKNVRLFCTIYDPATGRYIFDYSVPVAFVTGLFSLGLILLFIIHLWRRG